MNTAQTSVQTPAAPIANRKNREAFEAIFVALFLALFIREFVVQAFKIPSGSMKQTLLIGDMLLVNKLKYGVKIPFTDRYLFRLMDPKRGEIIVFKFPRDPKRDFIKRVVGTPGDRVAVKDKRVYVNGVLLDEGYTQYTDPHINFSKRDFMEERVVPPDHYFVMGDNRDNSDDGREWGFVPRANIKGSAFMIYFSWDNTVQRDWGMLGGVPGLSKVCFDGSPRWDRIGRVIK